MTNEQLEGTLRTLFPRRRDFFQELIPLESNWDDPLNIGYRELVKTL